MNCPTCLRKGLEQKADHPLIMVIFENPTLEDLQKGIIGTGKRGELLNLILDALQINPQYVYLTSLLRCRPPRNRRPTLDEFNACKPKLLKEIQTINPILIIPLGAAATKAVLDTNAFSNFVGKIIPKSKTTIIPTYSLDHLITRRNLREHVYGHFKEAKRILEKYIREEMYKQEKML